MEIFKKILEWPIILQGALGSALFWFLLILGQKITGFISSKWGKDKEVASYFGLLAKSGPSHELKVHGYLTCIYACLHYFIKALIVIVLSILISPINHVVSIVGYLISIYFLFRSLSYVQHFTSLGNAEESREKLLAIGEKYLDKKSS